MTITIQSLRVVAATLSLLAWPPSSTPARGEQAVPSPQQIAPEERAALQARQLAASEVDRRRMMDLIGVRQPDHLPPPESDPNRPQHLSQRPGSNDWYDEAGNTHVRSAWGVWSNYDESKAGGYTLPNPLVLRNGSPVSDAATWWNRRRPEILEDFRAEIYGRIPAGTPTVTFAVTSTDAITHAGLAVLKHVEGRIDNSRYPAVTPRIDITMYLPPRITRPVPIVVMAGTFFGRNAGELPAAVTEVLSLGWAYATVNTSAIQADNGAGLSEGIIGLVGAGTPRAADDWGVLAAWSWGLSRALDYFETDASIDAKRAAIQGHSRWGKTALLAGALDQRWAMVFSSCSGAMGASLEMRHWGETIDNVAGTNEYHWMAGNFLKYAGHWKAMPVDAHSLIALVAPRPVFITGGTRDQWSDPHGEFLAAVGADPVYRLLGRKGLGTTTMPAADVSLIDGDLAFRNHEGGHTDAPDWPVFLQFAQRYFTEPSREIRR